MQLQPGAEPEAPKPQGMLFVRVCGATDIPRFDWKSMVSKPDTFVTCAPSVRTAGSCFACYCPGGYCLPAALNRFTPCCG